MCQPTSSSGLLAFKSDRLAYWSSSSSLVAKQFAMAETCKKRNRLLLSNVPGDATRSFIPGRSITITGQEQIYKILKPNGGKRGDSLCCPYTQFER